MSYLRNRRRSDSSNEGKDFLGGRGLFVNEDDGEGFDREARRMYRVLSARDPKLTSSTAIQRMVHEVDDLDQINQEELLERLFNAADVEEKIDETVNSPENEEDFVETLRQTLEVDGEEKEETDGNGSAKLPRRLKRKLVSSRLDSFVEYILNKINQQWVTLAYAIFPFHQVQTLVLICLVQFISVQYLLQLVPILTSYLSFIVMIYYTLKMFQDNSAKRHRNTWKRLIDVFGDDTVRGRAGSESHFNTSNNWEPYMNFVLAMAVFILSVGASGRTLPYCSLLCGVSAFFALTTFVSLADDSDKYARFSVIANLFSCLPVTFARMKIAAGYWRIWKPLIFFKLGYLSVSIGFPSLCLMSIPVLYGFIAMRKTTWSEAAHSIVPHFICIIWSDIAMTLFMIGWRGFGYVDLILTAALVSLFFFPTAAAGAIIGVIFFVNLKNAIDLISILKALITVLILISPFIITKVYQYVSKLYKLQVFPESSHKRRWLLAMIYLAALLMAISFLYEGQMSFDSSADVTNMTWAQYDKHCSVSAANNIQRQVACSQLKGTAVNWRGSVQSVRIVNIDNSFETLLGYLPESLSQSLRCFYDSNRTDTANSGNGMRPNECSLTDHNVYTFEIEVSGPYGERSLSVNKGQLILSASHVFYEQLSRVDEGDVVRFIGFFEQYPIYRYPPKLKLLQLECVNCKQMNKGKNGYLRLVSSKMNKSGLWRQIFDAFKFCFNFVFAPLIKI